jgi:aspartate-semialdehyde dehydrogenase
MAELREQTENYLAGRPVTHELFAHPIPFNVIPQIDKFQDNGYTKEEMKVVWETRKICSLPDLLVSCTAVRIPTFRAHAEAIVIETEKPIDPVRAREILSSAPGVKVVDDPAKLEYPMPLNATEKYDVEVGRIRQNLVFGAHGLEFFVCGDQILKGAALNAVQIAEQML